MFYHLKPHTNQMAAIGDKFPSVEHLFDFLEGCPFCVSDFLLL